MTKAKFSNGDEINLGTDPFAVVKQDCGLYAIKNTKTGLYLENGVCMAIRNDRPSVGTKAGKFHYAGHGIVYKTPNLAHALCEAHLVAGFVKLGHTVACTELFKRVKYK